MKRFIIFAGKRMLFTVPQLLAVSVIVFFLIRLLPGDPILAMAGEPVLGARRAAGSTMRNLW